MDTSEPAAWRVTPGWASQDTRVDVGNAGTVMRFVPPVAALTSVAVEFHGDPAASQRPVAAIIAALREIGAVIDDGGRGAIPFTVRGAGAVPGGTVTVDASASSQLVSGLLLAAPGYDKGLEVRHRGPRAPSAPHIAMTVQMLRDAGATVETGSAGAGAAGRRRPPGHLVRAPGASEQPPGGRSAGCVEFRAVPGRRAGHRRERDDPGLARGDHAAGQPDPGRAHPAGRELRRPAAGLTVTGTGRIRGITADLADCNEISMVTGALAALADSPSVLTGIGHQRTHETDRLAALATEINALGGDVTELADGLEIRPRPLRAAARPFATYDDHRLVMAAAVLGLAVPGLAVATAATVGKTFPEFTDAVGGDAGAGSLNRRPGTPTWTRTTSGSGPAAAPGRAPGARPAHEDAAEAFVASVDRGRYGCLLGDRMVTAMRARELGRRSVVVGDQVALAGDISGAPGTLARVVRVEPRTSVLRRSADDTDPVERVIVANADQLVIVTALADPPPRPRLIDRFLVAAYDAGLSPLLCLTKSDLAPATAHPATRTGRSASRIVVLGQPLTQRRLDPLRAALAGRVSVLVGHSGVGKSTLVNALIPDADRAVGTVNPVTGRGRHTSSSAVALPLPRPGGWLIDTPGLRGFGLAHVSPERVVRAFPDLAPGAAACPRRLHPPGAGLRARRLGPRPGRGPPPGGPAGLAAPPAAQPGRRRPELTRRRNAGRQPSRPRASRLPGSWPGAAPIRYRFAPWRDTTMTCVSPTSSPTRPTTSPRAASGRSTCASSPSRT